MNKLEIFKRRVKEINHCKKSKIVIEGPAFVWIFPNWPQGDGMNMWDPDPMTAIAVLEGWSLIETIHDWGRLREHWVRRGSGVVLQHLHLDTLSWLGGDSIMQKSDRLTEKHMDQLHPKLH